MLLSFHACKQKLLAATVSAAFNDLFLFDCHRWLSGVSSSHCVQMVDIFRFFCCCLFKKKLLLSSYSGEADQCDIQVVWSLQDLCIIVRHSAHRWKHQPHKRKPAKVVASLSNYKLRSQNVRKINPTVNVVATLLACQVTAALLWWLLCPAREPLASITDKPPFVDLSPQFSFYRVLCLKRCLHCVFSFSVSCR